MRPKLSFGPARLPLAAAALAALACGTPAASEPPRWIVSDQDSELILFPTIHFLPHDLSWRTPGLQQQLSKADEIWFEIPFGPEAQAAAQKAIIGAGVDRSRSLSEELGPELWSRTAAAAKALDLDPRRLEPMRPWLAALTLLSADLSRSGLKGENGVDPALAAMAEDKPQRALETPKAQAEMFAAMTPELQAKFLKSALDEIGTSGKRLQRIAQAWSKGDLAPVQNELVGEMKRLYPRIYQAMFADRNQRWLDLIEKELAGSGQDFVAVGAGHLVGPDGIPTLLRSRGYTVRYQAGSDGGGSNG